MLRRLVVVLLVWGVAAMAAGRACAQEHTPPKKAEHAAAGKAASQGDHPTEEKSNVFKGILDLTIWTIVVFLLLVLILGKYAWGPMLEGLQKREDAIHAA